MGTIVAGNWPVDSDGEFPKIAPLCVGEPNEGGLVARSQGAGQGGFLATNGSYVSLTAGKSRDQQGWQYFG